jgi:LacI family transcriptional regulator
VKKKVSINDIAKQLGISITTVSFILNGRAKEKRISDKLVKTVLDLVEELNYKPNTLARSLRTGKTNIIGLMVEDISDPFFGNIARLIEENAYKNGYKIIYCSTENKTEKTLELIQMFRDRHVDGYIIVPPEGIEDEIKSLIASNKPVVLFDRHLPAVDTDYVVIDNKASAYHATEHLINNGYKNIGLITLSSLQPQMQDRLAGYEEALKHYALPGYVKEISGRDNNQVVKQVTAFVQSNKELDAIFFATNYLCVRGLKAIKALKLRIPNDLAIVSFDEYELFEMYSPPVSTVSQPVEQISEHVINLLLAKLDPTLHDKKNQKIILPTSFISRQSSGKA